MFKYIALSGVCVALIYLIVAGPSFFKANKDTSNSRASRRSDPDNNDARQNANSEIELTLQSNDPFKLQRYYESLKVQRNIPFAIRLEHLEQRQEIVGRILVVAEKDGRFVGKFKEFAELSELEIAIEREEIAIKHKVFDSEANTKLTDLAKSLTDKFPEVARPALCLALISKFIAESESEDRQLLKSQALKEFDSTAVTNNQNKSVAEKLRVLVEFVLDHGTDSEGKEFANTYVTYFSQLESHSIEGAIVEFKAALEITSEEYPEIVDVAATLREKNLRDLIEKIDNNLKQVADLDDQSLSIIADRTRDLIRVGRIDTATKITNQLASVTKEKPQLISRINQLRGAIELCKSTFDPIGLKNLDGSKFSFGIARQQKKILLFVDTNNVEQYARIQKLIHNTFGDELKKYWFGVVVVDRDYNFNAMAQLISIIKDSNVLILPAFTEQGQRFQRNIPLKKTPFVILLDEKQNFLAVDPPTPLLAEIVSQVE